MHAGEDEVLWVSWLIGSFDETVPTGGLLWKSQIVRGFMHRWQEYMGYSVINPWRRRIGDLGRRECAAGPLYCWKETGPDIKPIGSNTNSSTFFFPFSEIITVINYLVFLTCA